ncbi:MAG: hypothetical protein Q8P44_09705, partial [Dehalococcoidia bacterium]|nr:hypothetical protein [Dehalococcoidia bacterium]
MADDIAKEIQNFEELLKGASPQAGKKPLKTTTSKETVKECIKPEQAPEVTGLAKAIGIVPNPVPDGDLLGELAFVVNALVETKELDTLPIHISLDLKSDSNEYVASFPDFKAFSSPPYPQPLTDEDLVESIGLKTLKAIVELGMKA